MKELLAADKRNQSHCCWIGFLLFCEVKSWSASQTWALVSFSQLKSVAVEFCSALIFTGRLNLLFDQHYIVDNCWCLETVSHLISVKLLGFFIVDPLCEMFLCWCAIIIKICKEGEIDTSDVHFMQQWMKVKTYYGCIRLFLFD